MTIDYDNSVAIGSLGAVRITLPDGTIFVLFLNQTFELLNPSNASPDDEHVSMPGAMRLPNWMANAIRIAAIEHKERYGLNPIPTYGDHISIETFHEWCTTGYVTDYDGTGYYATEEHMTRLEAIPSEIKQGIVEKKYNFVVWFNK